MAFNFKKVAAIAVLAATVATASVSVASAKIGSPDIGFWHYGGGNIIAGDVYSHYSPMNLGYTTWHSASVKNGKTYQIRKSTKYDNSSWAKATIAWSTKTDYSYYDHD